MKKCRLRIVKFGSHVKRAGSRVGLASLDHEEIFTAELDQFINVTLLSEVHIALIATVGHSLDWLWTACKSPI